MPAESVITRRGFLSGALAVAGATIVPARVFSADAPSNRIAIGCVGVGGRGRLNVNGLLKHGAQIQAICDVDDHALTSAQRIVGGCAVHRDSRELIARRDIDAVMIATPDHWHVPIAIAAVAAGKDIYVEKPLGVTIDEGKKLRAAVRRYGAVFMHGTEQRSMSRFRQACELVRNGRIGKVHTVLAGCPGGRRGGAEAPAEVPAGLDYDRWLGPAPRKPYSAARVRTYGWYYISDYASSGFMAGWGVHPIDIAQWGLGADDSGPVAVEGTGDIPADGLFDTPVTWRVEYTYADGMRMIFTDSSGWGFGGEGVRFIGTDGWIHVSRSQGLSASSESVLRSTIGPNEIRLCRSDSDDGNFIECVKTRRPTAAPIEAAHRSTTVCYLGHIAIVLGRKLRWDPAAERFVGDDAANRMLVRAYREPWGM